MKSRERITAFFGSMLIAFGLSALNFEQATFASNQKAYIAMIAGAILLLIFYINFRRNCPQS